MQFIQKIVGSYLSAVCLACLAVSCKKLIEIPPNPADRVATKDVFSDSSNVMNVLSGLYNGFDIVDNGYAPDFHNGGVTVYTGLSGDELINRDISYIPFQGPFYINSLLPSNAYLSTMWTKAYKTIYHINISLAGITGNNSLSTGFKNQVGGELKTIRAWCYFHLLNMYGGVPLVTGTDFRVNAVLPRASQDEVYAQIIADLEDAAALLLPDYPSDGHARPNVYTAKALLAKVYLYRQNWQQAASLAGDVIDAGLYALETDLNNVFFHGSSEAIWQYPSDGAGYSETNESYAFLPSPWNPDAVPAFEITPALFNAFETGDLRKTGWINAQDVNGTLINYPFKYKKLEPYDAPEQEDYMMLRLAEQYLIRAEARAQLDQSTDALDDLNAIRFRAGLSDLSFTDKATLLADIMQERRVELFCEWGNRWYDLKRTGEANAVLGTKPNWQPTDVLYPIPLIEMQTNPFLVQNPGY